MNLLRPIQMCSEREILGDETLVSIVAGQVDAAALNAMAWPGEMRDHKHRLTMMVAEWVKEWDDDLIVRLGRIFNVREQLLSDPVMIVNQVACHAYDAELAKGIQVEMSAGTVRGSTRPEDQIRPEDQVPDGVDTTDLDSSCCE